MVVVSTNFTLEVYDYDFGKGLILFEKPQIFKEKQYNEEENHWIYHLARDHHCGHLIYCGKEDNRSLLIREQSRTDWADDEGVREKRQAKWILNTLARSGIIMDGRW